MSLPRTEADAVSVADKVLKRAEVSKIARRLQDRLALAQFKAKNGWEDLTLDKIEPKVEEERRRRRLAAAANQEHDHPSDVSSTGSDFPYPRAANGLMSSPLKAPPALFGDSIMTPSASGSGTGRGQRKRSYLVSFEEDPNSGHGPARTLFNPTKRIRAQSPSAHGLPAGHATWKDVHQLAQSSPIKPKKHHKIPRGSAKNKPSKQSQVFQAPPQKVQAPAQFQKELQFTASGPMDLFQPLDETLTSPQFAPLLSDDDDMSNKYGAAQSSPPRTPPMRARCIERQRVPADITIHPTDMLHQGGADENINMLMYLGQSPNSKNNSDTVALSMVNNSSTPSGDGQEVHPKTPPPRNSMLPSSLMTTPGGSNLFNTPGQAFDFADYVNITPSPAQKTWTRTPGVPGGARTPLGVKRLEFPSEFR